MNKKDYVVKHSRLKHLTKKGKRDADKLDRLSEKSFEAWKEYHKSSDKYQALYDKGKHYEAAKFYIPTLKLLIKAQEIDNEYHQHQIDCSDMKLIYAEAKKHDEKVKKKKSGVKNG